MFDRRAFLSSGAILGTGSLLGGCTSCKPIPDARCETQLGALVPNTLLKNTRTPGLIVDVHTHIFNAHDVPMEDYFTRPVLHLPPPVDDLVKAIMRLTGLPAFLRALAPCARDEYAALCELTNTNTFGPSVPAIVESRIKRGDEDFAEGIVKYANDESFRALYRRLQNQERQAQPDALAPILPENMLVEPDEVIASLATGTEALGVPSKVAGIWRFLRRIASPRYENAYRMMALYADERAPVDIFVAATLDFDSSLTPSRPSTPVLNQARVMALINRLTQGRVLPMVGYDPRRDVESGGAALEDVKTAVDELGHLGVKLYPPMGFAPFGNTTFPGFDKCEWPADDLRYGAKLDDILTRFYEYTLETGLPILAHSSESNGIRPECQVNGSPESWAPAFDAFPGLRVCAGHFGGLSEGRISTRMKAFVQAIKARPNADYYVDLSFLPEIFDCDSDLGRGFARLLETPVGAGTFADHVLFGTDWFMLSQDESERDYVKDAARYLACFGHQQKVMRNNAAKYLNLAAYLERQRADIDPNALADPVLPHWADKLPS